MKIETTRRLAMTLMLATVPFLGACEAGDMEEDTDPGFETETPMTDETAGQDGMGDMQTGTMGTAGFNEWDTDDSGYLTEDEFTTNMTQQNVFTDWDTDGDTYLNEDEFTSAFENEDWFEDALFGDWDADGDGQLTQDELGTGLYDTWDENADDQLTQAEFDQDLF